MCAVPIDASCSLAQMAARYMRLNVTIQDGNVFIANGTASIELEYPNAEGGSNGR